MSDGWAPYLDPGERILWEGRPDSRLFLLRQQDTVLIPFSLVWGGFAVFWNLGVWTGGAPLFFSIFGLPFLIVGAYITIGRFYHDQIRRRGTVYALSTKRAFIARSSFGRSLTEKRITQATSFEFQPGPRATLTFDPQPFDGVSNRRSIGSFSGNGGQFTFEAIEDGDRVYQIARDIQRGDTE